MMGSFFLNQLRQADLILLNKIDLMLEEEISECVAQLHESIPGCRIFPVTYSQVDPDSLCAEDHGRSSTTNLLEFPGLHYKDLDQHYNINAHDLAFVSFNFSSKQPLDEARFRNFVEQLPWEAFRIKGTIRFADRNVFLNYVGGMEDWSSWEKQDDTNLVFVGWNISGKNIMARLRDCVLDRW